MENTQNEMLENHYEGRYISLKPSNEVIKKQEKNEEIFPLEDNAEAKDIIQPYMSEEIHSVLKEMGAYLLEEELDEIAATIDESKEESINKLHVTLDDFRMKLPEFIKGKKLTKHIICQSGEYIGRQGEEVTPQMIQVAKENGCMIKVIMHSE